MNFFIFLLVVDLNSAHIEQSFLRLLHLCFSKVYPNEPILKTTERCSVERKKIGLPDLSTSDHASLLKYFYMLVNGWEREISQKS